MAQYLPVSATDRRHEFDPRVRKIPSSRKWQPTPVFLPGKFHGLSLVGYSSWGSKELDMTEHKHICTNTHNTHNIHTHIH